MNLLEIYKSKYLIYLTYFAAFIFVVLFVFDYLFPGKLSFDYSGVLNVVLGYINLVALSYILKTYDKRLVQVTKDLLLVKIILFFALSVIVYMLGIRGVDLFMYIWFLMGLIFSIDYRINIIVLIDIMVYLLLYVFVGNKVALDNTLVYFYYFFVISVINNILENLYLRRYDVPKVDKA